MWVFWHFCIITGVALQESYYSECLSCCLLYVGFLWEIWFCCAREESFVLHPDVCFSSKTTKDEKKSIIFLLFDRQVLHSSPSFVPNKMKVWLCWVADLKLTSSRTLEPLNLFMQTWLCLSWLRSWLQSCNAKSPCTGLLFFSLKDAMQLWQVQTFLGQRCWITMEDRLLLVWLSSGIDLLAAFMLAALNQWGSREILRLYGQVKCKTFRASSTAVPYHLQHAHIALPAWPLLACSTGRRERLVWRKPGINFWRTALMFFRPEPPKLQRALRNTNTVRQAERRSQPSANQTLGRMRTQIQRTRGAKRID